MAQGRGRGNFNDRPGAHEQHVEAGRKGGKAQGKGNNPGNFANRDPEDVRRAAKKGGES